MSPSESRPGSPDGGSGQPGRDEGRDPTTDPIHRRLSDLATFAREAAYVTARGRAAYLADDAEGALLRNAGERILIKVATVGEKLPQDVKDQHDGLDWVGISRMRNLVAHHYDRVRDDMMWAALENRIPALAGRLAL